MQSAGHAQKAVRAKEEREIVCLSVSLIKKLPTYDY
jgi:hypothetical protein